MPNGYVNVEEGQKVGQVLLVHPPPGQQEDDGYQKEGLDGHLRALAGKTPGSNQACDDNSRRPQIPHREIEPRDLRQDRDEGTVLQDENVRYAVPPAVAHGPRHRGHAGVIPPCDVEDERSESRHQPERDHAAEFSRAAFPQGVVWKVDEWKPFEEDRSEEHTSELQSPYDLVCRLLLEKK